MEINDKDQGEALMWLRYVLNHNIDIPNISDWNALFDFADKHKIVGVCNPTNSLVVIERKALARWFGRIQSIRSHSKMMNQRVVMLVQILKEAGFKCCILKGQGNAELYPDPMLRTAGDIDVWIDADEQKIVRYVKEKFPQINQTFKHIKFPIFRDAPIDIHQTPLKLYHPRHNRRLQEWIIAQKKEQMEHAIQLTGTEVDIFVPTAKFNAVYQLGHILIHIQDEGVGLRHLVDYFYVLMALGDLSEIEKNEILKTWKELGMMRLAAAIMWIEHETLGLSEKYILIKPHKGRGLLLLKDVLEGGNFGHSSTRQDYKKKGYAIGGIVMALHVFKLSSLFPGEAMYKLISKIWTYLGVVKN